MDEERRRLEEQIPFNPQAQYQLAAYDEMQDGQATLINLAFQRLLKIYNPPVDEEHPQILQTTIYDLARVIRSCLEAPDNVLRTWIYTEPPSGRIGEGWARSLYPGFVGRDPEERQHQVPLPYETVGITAVRYSTEYITNRSRSVGSFPDPGDILISLTHLKINQSWNYFNALDHLRYQEQVHDVYNRGRIPSEFLDYTEGLEVKIGGPYTKIVRSLSRSSQFQSDQLLGTGGRKRAEYFVSVKSDQDHIALQNPRKYVVFEGINSGFTLADQENPIRHLNHIISFTHRRFPPLVDDFFETSLPYKIREMISRLIVNARLRLTKLDMVQRWLLLVEGGYF